MTLNRNAWNNFKSQPEIWFFYAFLITSMLSVRKVLADYPIDGSFNEYTGTYLYLSDLFLLSTLITWLFPVLYNKIFNLSISKLWASLLPKKCTASAPLDVPRLPHRMFPVEHSYWGGTFLPGWDIFYKIRGTSYALLIPLILVAWSFSSVSWSNSASVALCRSFKLFEFYLLYLFLVLNWQCSTPARAMNFLRNIFRIIIAIGLSNAVIGIFQFILQRSLGLFWLKESLISPDLPGVAKIVLNGSNYIRSYGLFPHPNILGGFLFLSILLTLTYQRLFHVEQFRPGIMTRCASWVNSLCKIYSRDKVAANSKRWFAWNNFSPTRSRLFSLILVIQIVGGILTFSKSAILGLILALAYMFHTMDVPPKKECSPWNIQWGRRGTIKRVALLIILVVLVVFIANPDFGSIFVKSLKERLLYTNIAENIISSNLLSGIGFGQFVFDMQNYSKQTLLTWQFQPVHNVFLLIFSELGLVGLGLIIWLIWKLFRSNTNVPHLPRETRLLHVEQSSFLRGGTFGSQLELQTVFKALLVGFLVIALFDHYLWDIQQGQIMLWLAFGFLARTGISSNLTK